MNTAICNAISNRSVILFTYDGGERRAEPHAHGTSTAGNEVVRGYQVGGASQSGESVGWKLYSVSKITNLSETGDVFSDNRPGYNPNDQAMSVVHCHV